MPRNKDLPNNHISKKSSMASKEQIDVRFKLLEACIKGNIEVTEEILAVLDTDKSLLTFTGNISGIGAFTPIARNTVVNHGKLIRMQSSRVKAKEILTDEPEIKGSSPDDDTKSKKETKASLKADKARLENDVDMLNSELASLRSAYRQLLREVQNKLPLDQKIAGIVESHNQSSILRDRARLRVIK